MSGGENRVMARLESAFDFDRGDPALDRLARLAARLTGAPVGLVTLVGERRQNFLGLSGVEDRGTPIELSICRLAVITDDVVVIDDAVGDDRAPVPTVEELGVQSYAGVPLHADGRAVGALCAIGREPRHWTPDDLAVLEDLAATAEVIIDARLSQEAFNTRARRDQETSLLLQRSLLPLALPQLETVEFAAAYQPAANVVGGDFYDAFRLPDDRVAFALGDVVGHGIEAAAAASQIRNTLRISALEDASPGFVAARINDLANAFPPVAYSSVVYGLLEPSGCLDWINLGHPAALLRAPDGTVTELAADHPVLGVHTVGTTFTGQRLDLESDTTLIVYTDGLVERRLGDDEDRVAKLTALLGAEPDPEVVIRGALGTITGQAPRDDVALLGLRHRHG